MGAFEGRRRVVIEGVQPEIDCGRYPAKGVAGEIVRVEADVFADGHDQLSGVLLYRCDSAWCEAPLKPLVNDRWFAEFTPPDPGDYVFSIEAWVDHFLSWRRDLVKRVEAGTQTQVDFEIGAGLVEQAAGRASRQDALKLHGWAARLKSSGNTPETVSIALEDELMQTVLRYPDRSLATRYGKELRLQVDRPRAGFSTWYELFPRSCASEAGKHGTFRDCAERLPYVASMGFDVVYLPPIHPIGEAFRKGKNNVVGTEPGDPGSPWAIGGREGGHKAIHPELGTLDDFRALVKRARELNMEVALDVAFQVSPDHPYAHEHPEWFLHRPDGTIQYAENPPKKYQDIYPFHFESADWKALWQELKSVFEYWIEQGVYIFRVDNPHTKPFGFWEWALGELKRDHPGVLFLSEAFTRPKVMYRLAKLGFSQSYTYFAWRNSKYELTEYFEEITSSPVAEFFRPNVWPNTPDILHEYLQTGGRPAFMIRYALAATLSSNIGIYGPAYELCENEPAQKGSEEYKNSEKYEIRHRDLDAPWSLRDYIARLNRIRRENPALQQNRTLRFHGIDNDALITYSKTSRENVILAVVNLDFRNRQAGWTDLDLEALGLRADQEFGVHDLLTNERYRWSGPRNFVMLDPHAMPAHIFLIEP